MSEGMSKEQLAELEAHYGRPYPEIASSRSALSTAVATVRLLLVEVKRLRGVERDQRATIADEHSRLSQEFENEEQLRQERDQARAELAAMREEIGETSEAGDQRDRATWCWTRNPHGRLHCGRLAGHEPPHRRGDREWYDVEEGDDR